MIIINATIALSPLCHEVAIESRIGHRILRHGLAKVLGGASVIRVLRSHVCALPETPEEESSSDKGTESDHTDNNTSSNGSSVRAILILFLVESVCCAHPIACWCCDDDCLLPLRDDLTLTASSHSRPAVGR